MKTWNERFKFARANKQLRQNQIADKVGVSSATVSDWESGEIKTLEGENLLKVCDVLGISPHWLLLGKGDMVMEALTNDDYHALKINRALGVKERRAWYRAGDSLAEPDEPRLGNNGTK